MTCGTGQAVTRVGTAGWTIPRASAHLVTPDGTHLHRYARRFAAVEINSSFYRPHAFATYARWAAATPPEFRFALKLPRGITHEQRLRRPRMLLDRFLTATAGLGAKRGPLLVQLPPSHAFDPRVVARFLDCCRSRYEGPMVCEPRHPTWFTAASDRLLDRYRVARVAADPPLADGAAVPGGWPGLVYFRLHGSPRTYWSRYSDDYVRTLASILQLTAGRVETWCVFDNTALGGAIENAAALQARLGIDTACVAAGL